MTTTPEQFNQIQVENGSLSPARITELVYAWQEAHSLTADGKAGAIQTIPTIDAAITRRHAPIVPPPVPPPVGPVLTPDQIDQALAAAGQRAVAAALAYWNQDIIDPAVGDVTPHGALSRAAIEQMLTACDWTWEVPYHGNPQIAWCIIFLGACWRKAGLRSQWLQDYWASTERIVTWARYVRWSPKAPANPRPSSDLTRLIAECDKLTTKLPFVPRAGDIVLVGRDNDPATGRHGTLCESYDPVTRTFATIEGNATGLGPDGTRREGVIRNHRQLGGSGDCVRFVIRPAPTSSDLILAA